ncbi:uncharacterized protein LOC134772652 [Penaeus indicus]|uniref:uncharacterized protein LOC134772652 n=1 Tax=Penaeus indicus TaxID=29960 RepID=UPI00300C457C
MASNEDYSSPSVSVASAVIGRPRRKTHAARRKVIIEQILCECGQCCNWATPEENSCCQEKVPVVNTIEEYNDGYGQIKCITEHPGFNSQCLDIWVLQQTYLQNYRKKYNEEADQISDKYRYTAYRQLVRWCWQIVGKNNRMPLPSCAYKVIRETFPSDHEPVGFKYPELTHK